MSKITVIKMIDENGESHSYVDYGEFCKMQGDYEEKIENEHEQFLEMRNKLELQIDFNLRLSEQIQKMKCLENFVYICFVYYNGSKDFVHSQAFFTMQKAREFKDQNSSPICRIKIKKYLVM